MALQHTIGYSVPYKLLSKYLLDTQLEKLTDCNTEINTTLLNEMVCECLEKVKETTKYIGDYEEIIVAKAWRAVRKYNSISSDCAHSVI